MKKFKLLSLLLIISLFITTLSVPALALDAPDMTAQSAVVLDADSGSVLFQRNGSRAIDPGPLTTLMTALLAADAIGRQDIFLDDAVTVTDNAHNGMTETSITSNPAVVTGEVLTVEDLIYLCLFNSSADAANTLAEFASGSIDLFLDAMNRKAEELGCQDTRFVNVNGEMAEGQTTTARDLALVARAVIGDNTLSNLLKATSYTVDSTEAAGARAMANPIPLNVEDGEYYYENALGVKMATVTDLGVCMLATATYNEMNVITVSLGCADAAACLNEARTVFDWVFTNFDHRLILSAMESIDSIPVELGSPSMMDVRPEHSVSLILPLDQQLGEVEYELTYDHEQDGTKLEAPISAGAPLGTVTVYMDGKEYGSSRLVAANSVDISRMEYLRAQLDVMLHTPSVRHILTALIVVLALYLLLVCFYMFQRIRHTRSLRKARKDRAIAQAQRETEWLDIPNDEEDEVPEEGYPEAYPETGDDLPPEPKAAFSPKDKLRSLFSRLPHRSPPAEDAGEGYETPEDDFVQEQPEEVYQQEPEEEYVPAPEEEYVPEPEPKPKRRWGRKKRQPEPEPEPEEFIQEEQEEFQQEIPEEEYLPESEEEYVPEPAPKPRRRRGKHQAEPEDYFDSLYDQDE